MKLYNYWVYRKCNKAVENDVEGLQAVIRPNKIRETCALNHPPDIPNTS